MLPTPPQGPFTLTLTLRGPELAVLVPRGDTAALLDVCRTLAQVWNGAGALIIPLDGDGASYDPALVPALDIRQPDQFFTHPTLSDELREAASRKWPRVAPWRDSAFNFQVHSWRLARNVELHGAPLPVPSPAGAAEELLSAVLWGYVDPEDLDEVRKQYVPQDVAGTDLLFTLLDAQINGLSPLTWGSRLLPTQSVNGPGIRSLYVLPDELGFDELVQFWNLRARYPRMPNGSLLVAAPGATLDEYERFSTAINCWIDRPPRGTKPDLMVDVEEEADVARAHAALKAAGLTYVDTGKTTTYSHLPTDRLAPEYTLGQTFLPVRLTRGLSSDAIVNLQRGPNRVRFPVPTGFLTGVSSGGKVTTIIGGLPHTFPMSDILAQDWSTPAVADGDELKLALGMFQEHITVDLNWPTAQTQMSKHMATAGVRAEPSAPGHLAEIFLARIRDQADLDPLALPHALGIMEALVVRRSARIAQQIRRDFQNAGLGQVDEGMILSALRELGLFAELESRTLAEMQGAIGASPSAILPTLAQLCEAGYIQRGRGVQCPACNTEEFWRLSELDDRMTCRACLQQFPLPAIAAGQEPPAAYRLDALAARLMGHDLVPVLLTLRHLLVRSRAPATGYWWPGLDLYRGDEGAARDQEIDLLYAENGELWVCEVKLNAAGMPLDQAEDLCRLAAQLRAVPVFSAPVGQWSADICELAQRENVLLLGPEELLEGAPASG